MLEIKINKDKKKQDILRSKMKKMEVLLDNFYKEELEEHGLFLVSGMTISNDDSSAGGAAIIGVGNKVRIVEEIFNINKVFMKFIEKEMEIDKELKDEIERLIKENEN